MALPEILFRLLQWAGAGVLLLLALQLLRAPVSPEAPTCGRAGRADFAGGLLGGISSPFNLVFFLALLPQFGLAEHGGVWSGLLQRLDAALLAAFAVSGLAAPLV